MKLKNACTFALRVSHVKRIDRSVYFDSKLLFSVLNNLINVDHTECFAPIGMESMKIKDNQITASSYWSPHKPFYARLNLVKFYDDPQKTAWCADVDDQAPYLTVDLKEERTITGVAIQGPSIVDNYVTSFKLCHSNSGRNFECLQTNGTEQVRLIKAVFKRNRILTHLCTAVKKNNACGNSVIS